MSRAECYRCQKPAAHCLCEAIKVVANKTGIIVLQHRHEQFHPLGTVRIAKLGLKRVDVHVANGADQRGMYQPVVVPPKTGLLFPSDSAEDLEDLPVEQRPEHLVVLDGTWSQVKGLYRDNPWLHDLPHYMINPASPSRYRIRAEPELHCLSTIESIAHALTVLEPETERIPTLVSALDTMIDLQTADIGVRCGEKRFRKRKQRPSRRVPRVLIEKAASIVAVYGESVQQRCRHDEDAPEVFQWTAVRIETGEVFECFVRPAHGTSDAAHLAMMDLSEADVDAVDFAEFRTRWLRFLGADGIIAAWDQSSLAMIEHAMGECTVVHLKSSYCNLRAGRCGSLADVLVREAVEIAQVDVAGRAARRLGRTLAIVNWLRASADTSP